MHTDSGDELATLSRRVGAALQQSRRRLVTAESCTGGGVAKAVTDVAGSSAWYLGGVVAYSDTLKAKLLGVSLSTLERHGAVSEAVASEMAEGALHALGGEVAVAVTGIAGPGGGSPGKPVGTVWLGWAWWRGETIHTRTRLEILSGNRENVRRLSVHAALAELLEL